MAMSETTFKSYLSKILSARYGEEVRGSIHDSLQGMYDIVKQNVVDVSSANKKIDTAITNANKKIDDAVAKANTATTDATTAKNDANKAADRANSAASVVESLEVGNIDLGSIATKDYVDESNRGGINLLPDTNVGSLWGVNGAGERLFSSSNITTAQLENVFVKLNDPPVNGVIWGIEGTLKEKLTGSKMLRWYRENRIFLKDGETYTMSCWARAMSGNPNLRMEYGSNKYISHDFTITSKEWDHYSWTFVYSPSSVNDTEEAGTFIYFGLSAVSSTNVGSKLQYCGMKLEVGDKATNWCLAPEDMEIEIGSTNLVLKSDNEQNKVTSGTGSSMGHSWDLTKYGEEVLNVVGRKICISYDARAEVAGQEILVNLRVGTGTSDMASPGSSELFHPLTTEYKRYQYVTRIIAAGTKRVWWVSRTAPSGQTGNVYVRNVKVELGNYPTCYSLAQEDTQYQPGDKIEITGEGEDYIVLIGYITSSSTVINCTFPLSKPISKAVKSVTISEAEVVGRQNGKYIIGESTTTEKISTPKGYLVGANHDSLRLKLTLSEAPQEAVNNDLLALKLCKFTMTFN